MGRDKGGMGTSRKELGEAQRKAENGQGLGLNRAAAQSFPPPNHFHHHNWNSQFSWRGGRNIKAPPMDGGAGIISNRSRGGRFFRGGPFIKAHGVSEPSGPQEAPRQA